MRSMIATLALASSVSTSSFRSSGRSTRHPLTSSARPGFRIGGTNISADLAGRCSRRPPSWRWSSSRFSRVAHGSRRARADAERRGRALVGIGRRTAAFAILLVSGALAGVAAVLLWQVYYPSPERRPAAHDQGADGGAAGRSRLCPGHDHGGDHRRLVEALTATYIGAERRARVALRADRRGAARPAARNLGHPGDDACVGSSTSRPSGTVG